MDLTSELEIAAANISQQLVVFLANMNEANMDLDKQTQFPLMLVLPPIVVDNRSTSGLWVQSVDFNAMFLSKLDQTTPDYKTNEVDILITTPMRKLAREFFNKLSKSELMYMGEGITKVTYTPTYGEFDSHLHGVIARCSFNIAEGVLCV